MDRTQAGQMQDQCREDMASSSSILQLGAVNSLRRKNVYFFTALILLTALLTGIGLYLGSSEMADANAAVTGQGTIFLVTIFFVLVVLLVSGLVYFHRTVIVPLENLCTALQRMTAGHLDSPVHINASGEVGQAGELVNDLSINMQEILLYIWNYSQQHFSLLERISRNCNTCVDADPSLSGLQGDIAEMERNTEELQAIVVAHDYFEVKLEQKKMVSDVQQEQTD